MVKSLNVKIKNVPASFWKRFLAYLVDMLIINLVVLIPFDKHITRFDGKWLDFIMNTGTNKSFMAITLFIVLFTLVYFMFLEYVYRQTIGKMFFNIYVESVKDELSLQQTILRNIIKPFSVVLAVDVAYMFFKKGHQRLFEIFSGTQVVEKGVILK